MFRPISTHPNSEKKKWHVMSATYFEQQIVHSMQCCQCVKKSPASLRKRNKLNREYFSKYMSQSNNYFRFLSLHWSRSMLLNTRNSSEIAANRNPVSSICFSCLLHTYTHTHIYIYTNHITIFQKLSYSEWWCSAVPDIKINPEETLW